MARTSSRPRQKSPLHLSGAFELFSKSKKIITSNIWVFGTLYAIPFFFLAHSWIWNVNNLSGAEKVRFEFQNTATGWSVPTVPSYAWGYVVGVAIITALLVFTVGIIIQIMSHAAQLEGSEGKTVSFDSAWKLTREIGWRMLGLYILVGLLIVGGLILFIVPGLIMLRRYFLAPYVLLDKKTGIREAMDISAAMTKAHSGSIWRIVGVMFLLGLFNIVPLVGGLIAFILGALYSVAPALRYQELKKLS